MPIITFNDVTNQLTKIFLDPLHPTMVTAYVGSSYVEDGFTFSGPNNLNSVVEYIPGLGSDPYITSENPNPALNSLPIVLTRGADPLGSLNGDLFGVTSIALDSFSPLLAEEVDFVGIDANGGHHLYTVFTDSLPGLQLFQLPSIFQSNLVSLAWSGVLLGLIPGGGFVPVGGHVPIADDIEVIKTSASTELDSFPGKVSGSTTATFKFSSDDPGASFQYKLDNASTWTAATSTVSLSGLSGGEHTFQVAAVNAAGIVDPSPAQYSWFVDTGSALRTIGFNDVPNQFTVGGLLVLSGHSYVEAGYTFSPAPGQSLSSTNAVLNPNYNLSSTATITLTHGGDLFGVSSIKLEGFSPGLLGLFSPDVVTVDFFGTDRLGHVHTASFTTDALTGLETFTLPSDFQSSLKSFSWSGSHTIADDIVVNSAPDTVIIGAPPATTGSTTATFKFGASEHGASFQYKLYDAALTVIAQATTATSTVSLSGLGSGEHTIQVAAVDANGFVDPSPAAYTWTVDSTAPVISEVDLIQIVPSQEDIVIELSDLIKQLNQVDQLTAVTISVEDPITHLLQQTVQAVHDKTTSTWNGTFMGLSQGPHAVAFQTTDKAGAVSPLFELGTVTVDTIPPTSDISQALKNDTGASATDLITSDGRVTVSGTASETVSSVQIWDALSNTMVGKADVNGKTWSFTGDLAEGSYELYAKLTDLSGNVGRAPGGTDTEPKIVVDKTAPIPVMLNAVFDATTKLTTLSGKSEADRSVSIYDSGTLIGTTKVAADGTWSLRANVTGNTVHSYTEKTTDLAGNVGGSAGVTLYTPAANKALTGGPGDDVLIARPNDTLKGMGGSDTFVMGPGFGKVTIADFVSAAKSASVHDIINLHQLGIANFGQVHIAQSGTNAVITVDQQDIITLVGVKPSDLSQDDFSFS